MANTGLNHRRLRARCEFQKHAGYAHGVIEVAFRGKHRLFAAGLPQNGGNHLRGGGLTVGPHDTDERNRKLRAPGPRQCTVGFHGVGHNDLRAGRAGTDVTLDDEHAGTAVFGGNGVVVSVKIGALEGDKNRARCDGAAVGADLTEFSPRLSVHILYKRPQCV